MSIVSLVGASKNYHLGKTLVWALKHVSLAVEPGEFLALAGPSGSGKTTALNLIGCIDTPSDGSVFIDGQQTSTLSSDELADIRAQKLSFIFQNFNLLPVLTALENVEYALFNKKNLQGNKKALAAHALDSVGLGKFFRHKPLELSGGQQQRVAIARAIVTTPLIVLADEPTANLDHATGEEILSLMKKINRELKTTFIFSTHDQKVMDKADRIIRLFDGGVL